MTIGAVGLPSAFVLSISGVMPNRQGASSASAAAIRFIFLLCFTSEQPRWGRNCDENRAPLPGCRLQTNRLRPETGQNARFFYRKASIRRRCTVFRVEFAESN